MRNMVLIGVHINDIVKTIKKNKEMGKARKIQNPSR